LLLAYLIGGFNFFIFINQYSYITFVLSAEPFNLSASWIGLLFVTYLSGTFASAISGKVAQRLGQTQCISLGIVILMLGSCVTLLPSIVAIVGGFFISSFGFFFSHSTVSSWVSRHATRAKASASSLYLLFYYVGASIGGFYLDPFWRWLEWNGVVLGSLLILCGTLLLSGLLFRLSNIHAKRMIRALD
jgi:YNFM family putative membrane transporter